MVLGKGASKGFANGGSNPAMVKRMSVTLPHWPRSEVVRLRKNAFIAPINFAASSSSTGATALSLAIAELIVVNITKSLGKAQGWNGVSRRCLKRWANGSVK